MVGKTLLATLGRGRKELAAMVDEEAPGTKAPLLDRILRSPARPFGVEARALHSPGATADDRKRDEEHPPLDVELPEDEGAISTFIWNSRECTGNELHWAVLCHDEQAVRTILEARPSLIHSRFKYYTLFKDERQEGSGEAIHLAASRCSRNMMSLLLEKNANINAHVTRHYKAHYNVLHAAVFAEGRGGREKMVRFCLERGVEHNANLDGRWPLHLAFQTGQAELIPLLRQELQNLGRLEEVEGKGARDPTPLMVGIQMRKLGEEQLARAAALSAESLAVFIHHEPKCIPSFLERLAADGVGMPAAELAKLIKACDLPKVITECPEAADALITALTGTPECESEGWHPLPSRISFAPRNLYQVVQDVLNPERQLKSMYVPEDSWRYDTINFAPPAWHEELMDSKCSRPIRDVKIKVCHVPDLACADFLAALSHVTDDDHLQVYQNEVIRCVLDLVWWRSAIKLDVLNFILSFWSLALLVLETVYIDGVSQGADEPIRTSTDFIAARAIVELVHELMQFMGLWKIGRSRDYVNVGNAYDLFRCGLPAIMYADRQNRAVRILVILSYWMRLLEVNFSESMSRELLPIVRLAHGLGPASIVAFIGFCGLTHAFCALGDFERVSDVVLNSFSMLITGDIKAEGSPDNLRMGLTYVSVLLFTVFFLNIFIGVIGENYSIHKNMSPLIFQRVRGGICSTYLLRASVLPGALCPTWVALIAAVCAGLVAAILQVLSLHGMFRNTGVGLASMFMLCQFVMVVACYQNPDCPWSGCGSSDGAEPHYIWVAMACHKAQKSQFDRLEQGIRDLRDDICEKRSPASPLSAQDVPARRTAAPQRQGTRTTDNTSFSWMQ